MDQEAVDLRPAHQQALHAQDQPAAGAKTWTSSCGCYNPGEPPQARSRPGARAVREGRWRAYAYDELIARDKASLDIFWLKDETLADADNLPPPDVIAQEIVEDLEAALEQFG